MPPPPRQSPTTSSGATSLYDTDPHGEQTLRTTNHIKTEDSVRVKQEEPESEEKSKVPKQGTYSLKLPSGKQFEFTGRWDDFAAEVSREIKTQSGNPTTRLCEDESYDADQGSDNDLDTPEAQAMIESEVVNRETIKAEIRSKQAEEEINSPDFQTAITNDAKTQNKKSKDGKGKKSSKKATSKNNSLPKCWRKR